MGKTMQRWRAVWTAVGVVATVALVRAASGAGAAPPEFLGAAELPRSLLHAGTLVGGLSGLTYDPGRGVYYALSDDRSEHAPARFYTVTLDLAAGRLGPGGATVVGVTFLRDGDGRPFPTRGVDPEGIALSPAGTLYVSSEGSADEGVAPFVAEFSLDGRELRRFSIPDAYLPDGDGRRGVRENLAFESLTLTGDGVLYTATENALVQDGPAAARGRRSPSRLLRLDPATGNATGEYLYLADAVRWAPLLPGAFTLSGLVELLAKDDGDLLALERSYSFGMGLSVRLYEVSLAGADRLDGLRRGAGDGPLQPVCKRLLLDLDTLGLALGNLEGMTWGPRLPDGRRTLVLVADDNFSPRQPTQFLAFAWGDEPGSFTGVRREARGYSPPPSAAADSAC